MGEERKQIWENENTKKKYSTDSLIRKKHFDFDANLWLYFRMKEKSAVTIHLMACKSNVYTRNYDGKLDVTTANKQIYI